MNTGNMSNDEANKIANFIENTYNFYPKTPMEQIIESFKKGGLIIDGLDEHHFIQLEQNMIIEIFKYAQVLHATGDETRAEQFYNKIFKRK